MKTIIKGNERRTVSDKAARIATQLMGWSEQLEAKRPSEIGTRTRRVEPPIINSDNAIILKPAKTAEYPGDENKTVEAKTGETKGNFAKLPPADDKEKIAIPEKKTRKAPVKSKSTKK